MRLHGFVHTFSWICMHTGGCAWCPCSYNHSSGGTGSSQRGEWKHDLIGFNFHESSVRKSLHLSTNPSCLSVSMISRSSSSLLFMFTSGQMSMFLRSLSFVSFPSYLRLTFSSQKGRLHSCHLLPFMPPLMSCALSVLWPLVFLPRSLLLLQWCLCKSPGWRHHEVYPCYIGTFWGQRMCVFVCVYHVGVFFVFVMLHRNKLILYFRQIKSRFVCLPERRTVNNV